MAWMLEVNYSITILIVITNALIVITFLLLVLQGLVIPVISYERTNLNLLLSITFYKIFLAEVLCKSYIAQPLFSIFDGHQGNMASQKIMLFCIFQSRTRCKIPIG